MWTPKRLLILLGGLVLSMTGYLIYAFFLGGIDGLPLLSEDYLPIYVNGGIPPLPAPSDGEIDKKLKQAFGTECEEWRRPLLLNLTSKGILLAANQCDIETDGRVKLYPFSAALFPKNNRPDAPFPEINTVQCETAFLTLDRPVSHFSELSTRKIIGVELRGNRGITMINNRRTAEKNDDLDLLITNGPMFYAEKINKIWTDGYVQLLDNQTQPNPTKITAKGMDLKLAENTGPNRIKSPKTQVKGKNEGKNDGLNGVEMLILKSNVDMHLYVDASSGFLAGSTDLGKKQPPKGPMGEQPEKSHVIIKTNGPFHYDLTRELAWFDSPPVNAGAAPSSPEQQVLVTREHKVDKGKYYDQLLCDRLELQFRPKAPTDPKTRDAATRDPATRDPAMRDAAMRGAVTGDGSSGAKEIETALATTRTGEKVTLVIESENLEAYGAELHYRCAGAATGPQTILKGAPLHAVRNGHKIEARELHLIGADKTGAGQQAFAKGPGQIDMYDINTKRYPMHAVWKDSLIVVKEKEGDKTLDVLTMTGDASFTDEEHKQTLSGQRLQVHFEAPQGDSPKKGEVSETNRQKPHKIEAWEKVTANSPEMIVRYTNHLVIRFKYEPALDSSLPDSLSLPGLKKEGGPGDGAKTSKPAPNGPAKSRKPIELQANSVTAYVTTQGSKKELQYLVCEGTVHVHQEGETPKDKGVDITGELLNLDRHPKGDTLKVFGDSRTPGQLQLGELFLIGPKVTINQKDNVAEVDGAGAMNMPSNRTFDGGKTAKEGARLTVHWSQNMFFNGKDAYFDTSTSKDAPGGVLAYQDTASMKCQNLQVTLDKTVSFKEGQKENQGAKVEKLVCDRKVYIEDKVKGPGEKILKFDRLEATWLTMDNQDGPTIARGPNGRVTRLAPGSSEGPLAPPGPPPMPGAKDAKDLKNAKHPKENQRLMKTQVDFDGYMFSNTKDNSRNAKFYDNVEVKHWPSEDPDAVMDPDNPPKDGFFMRCELLNVFTRQIEGKTFQMMRAERKVFFRSKEFFGRADVMKYDEAQDQVIFEGSNGNHATLYKKKPDGTYEEIKGSKILYNRKTGVFQLEGGRVITSWLTTHQTSEVLETSEV